MLSRTIHGEFFARQVSVRALTDLLLFQRCLQAFFACHLNRTSERLADPGNRPSALVSINPAHLWAGRQLRGHHDCAGLFPPDGPNRTLHGGASVGVVAPTAARPASPSSPQNRGSSSTDPWHSNFQPAKLIAAFQHVVDLDSGRRRLPGERWAALFAHSCRPHWISLPSTAGCGRRIQRALQRCWARAS